MLDVADIDRWSAEAVREVFHAANARGQATLEASRQLSSLVVFDSWEGATAQARKHTNASIRQDLDAQGTESLAVAKAAGKAADDIEHVQSELRTLRADASELHMTIDPLTNTIIPASSFKGPPMEAEIAEMQLQPRLDKILAEANAVDTELAAAINMAEGNAPIPGGPPAAPVTKQNADSGKDTHGAASADKPPGAPGSDDGLGSLLGADDPAATATEPIPAAAGKLPANVMDLLAGKDGDNVPGPQYTRNPLTAPIVKADPSVIGQQAAKVNAARQAVDAAQAKVDAAARQALVQGPGAGPGRDVTDPLSQSLMDARRNLTDQTKILQNLNAAAAETGAPQAPVPTLPEHADVQSWPAPPSFADQAARGLTDASHDISKSTFGLVPDVAKDLHTFSHWGEASSGDHTEALLDSASLIPGGKIFGEAHHGLGALADAARHGDDIPTPHLDAPTPHTPVDAPDLSPGAGEQIPGVSSDGTTFSGHGDYSASDGYLSVPDGTTFTVYAEHGSTITDRLGNLIETGGDTSGVPSWTFHGGDEVPNYTLHPPDGLDIQGTPFTVAQSTKLEDLLSPNMGDCHWAACTYDSVTPTGKLFDVAGIIDDSTNDYTILYDQP
jgi:hypothetical protein